MAVTGRFLLFLGALLASLNFAKADVGRTTRDEADPCAVIGNKTWVAPADVRACFTSFSVDPAVKANIIDVINKTLAFHTSVNYELLAPEPFTRDVHEDVLTDLTRISDQQYASDFAMHVDLSLALLRLNDGHCVYINNCYDSLFVSYLPIPLVLLTDETGAQAVHIAPEAFSVASAEFGDELDVWQNALPGSLQGQLASLSGAKVLEINHADPFAAVDADAAISGSFQALGTRQNAFFASYNIAPTGYTYIMGRFAQMSLPLSDSVTLTIQRVNSSISETITLPYRSRIGSTTVPFTDSASLLQNNCVAISTTNGVDLLQDATTSASATQQNNRNQRRERNLVDKFRQAHMPPAHVQQAHAMNVMLDVTTPLHNVALPPELVPADSLDVGNGSSGSVMQFYLLDDEETGVLALGSFVEDDPIAFGENMLVGLQTLKGMGATRLIVDVSNNGGGVICLAHWLHRIVTSGKTPGAN